MMNCPVPIETSNKLKGWPGPVLTLSMNACSNLEAFILENRKDKIDSFITVRPNKQNNKGAAGAEGSQDNADVSM
ncbi:unnamed protein product [Allacma fusca]|uniref:Uncharacterized protein n=3 Tax=Allacma fusca TaxID=39272 RepID=A0A8J2KQX5_9HEXA|nr:unnamed protein product [Allacma fusca]